MKLTGPFISVVIIILALLVGSAAFYFTKKGDTPLEQGAEAVLRRYGIDRDFSPDDDGVIYTK